MLRKNKLLLCVLLGLLTLTFLVSAVFAAAPTNKRLPPTVVDTPIIQMQHWKDSSLDSKRGFLSGFATLLTLERDWRAQQTVGLDVSLIEVWATGLHNVSYSEMIQTLDSYAQNNPDKMDMAVLEVLWRQYVSPVLTPEMSNTIRNTYTKNKEAANQ